MTSQKSDPIETQPIAAEEPNTEDLPARKQLLRASDEIIRLEKSLMQVEKELEEVNKHRDQLITILTDILRLLGMS